MQNWILIQDFVLISGMSLLGLLILFLLKSKVDLSKKILIVFFLNSFFFLLYYYAYLHKIRLLGGIAVLFGKGFGFLIGPFLLFYIKALIAPKTLTRKLVFTHLIPFFIHWVLVSIPIALFMGFRIFNSYGKWINQVDDYLNLFENAFFIVYLIAAHRITKRISRKIENQYATIDNENLNWYKYLLGGMFFLLAIDSLCSIYELIFPIIPWNIGNIVAVILIIFTCILGYKGLFQAEIMLPDFLLQTNTDEKESKSSKDIADSHAQEEIPKDLPEYDSEKNAVLRKRLQELLEEEKVFLDHDLNLSKLAEYLEISDKQLSEFLNQGLNISFYNLINGYRVEEVKKRIANMEEEKYTLLGLAYESGFPSKASFHRIFKHKTGLSPSKYRQQVRDSENATV